MKQYPQIELREWTLVGEGYNGQAYVSSYHPGVMLKLVRREMGRAAAVEQEFYAAKTAYDMGLPVPAVYEIVRDGEDHGYLCEMIGGKKSLARLCSEQPHRIPELAHMMAKYGHVLHDTPITANEYVHPVKELLMKALESTPLVSGDRKEQLRKVVSDMPDTQTCLHGDFQPGNLILSSSDYYWIDLGWLGQGCYLMDLAHLYKMMVEDSLIPQVQELTHMTREQMLEFWDAFARAYTGDNDVESLNHQLQPYSALDIVRTYYLHEHDDPAFRAFLSSRIEASLDQYFK
jgi:uncharacterized protein (TIGR02172 family)